MGAKTAAKESKKLKSGKSTSKPTKKTNGKHKTKKDEINDSKKRPSSEIDDMFAGLVSAKRQKREKVEEEKRIEKEEKKKAIAIARQRQMDSKDDIKPVRYDEDGLPIYTEDQLKIGLGGDTPLCPFDCDCCF